MICRSPASLASLVLVLVLALAGVTPARAAPPSNDDFASATIIPELLPYTDIVDTREATPAPDDPDCFGNGPTVWYQFTPGRDIEIHVDTFGSDYDTTLAVYTGSAGNLQQIRCEDSPAIPIVYQSAFRFDAVANQTYYFMVGSSGSGSGGTLVFNLELFLPLTVDLQISPTGSFDKEGNAIVRMTLTCSRRAWVEYLEGAMEQKVGRRLITAEFSGFQSPCYGETVLQLPVSAENGRFKGGFAGVSVQGTAFDIVTWRGLEFEASTVVRLKKR